MTETENGDRRVNEIRLDDDENEVI